ncbi:unnamed protein product [Clonostachys rosea]|uniref:Heterokaryon incompatibility domain-containing protein n=1 Tax=Bionectria ochroleuca TaxID=29856 RepID=A0ABY6TUE8_BIOOC|nr:unnamed protein product [Clonostachys rosea]
MESKLFAYTALPQTGRFIRLLKIHPGASSDRLICELFPCDLDTEPAYTALSYVWGDPTKSAELICLDYACKIAQSLSDGLRRIRRADEAQIAWADAICINQNDQVEKGQQVNLMGDIYDKARDVTVWLGPDPTGSSHEAFRCLREINEKILTGTHQERYDPNEEERRNNPLSMNMSGAGPLTGRRSILPKVLGDRGKDCISELFSLTWFSRVWVLQEVGLATTATAFWGDSGMEFDQIAVFVYNVFTEEDLKFFLGPELSATLLGSPLYALWNVWSTYETKDSWMQRTPALRRFAEGIITGCDVDFTLVLEAAQHFNATNSLDYVYAFLGHPKARKPGTDKTWLQADYSLTLEDQHRLLASSLAEDSLNFLAHLQQTEESLKISEYPSWVPQWGQKHLVHAEAFWEAWDASLRKKEHHQYPAQSNGAKLSVSGLIIDTVGQSTPTMKPDDFEPIDWAGARLIETCWKLAMQSPYPYPREKVVDAFASTLICDHRQPGYPAVNLFAGFCMHADIKFFKKLETTGGLWGLDIVLEGSKAFGTQFKWYGTNRRFFTTKSEGLWGLGPAAMQQGDVCAVLFGADVPFILRPTEIRGEYKVVGECYMYNLMYGDAVLSWREGNNSYVKENIVLV